jgi:hypothetical protein
VPNIPRLGYIDEPVASPVVDQLPVDALMRSAEVENRSDVRVDPLVWQERDVAVAHGCQTEKIDTMLCGREYEF